MTSKNKLSLGDVVLCRFPHEENPGTPGPKLRPCLVVRAPRRSVFRRPGVEVAFGTSVKKPKPGTTLTLNNNRFFSEAGLDRPTTFLLGKRAVVPTNRGFLEAKVGSLPEHFKGLLRGFLDNEKESERTMARRYGQKKAAWTMLSEPNKEFQNA